MATTVTLATNRLQIYEDGVLKNSVTYVGIDSVNPVVQKRNRQMSAPVYMGTPTYSSPEQYQVEIRMRDGRTERILLNTSAPPATDWNNDQAGYETAEDDIYSSFP